MAGVPAENVVSARFALIVTRGFLAVVVDEARPVIVTIRETDVAGYVRYQRLEVDRVVVRINFIISGVPVRILIRTESANVPFVAPSPNRSPSTFNKSSLSVAVRVVGHL